MMTVEQSANRAGPEQRRVAVEDQQIAGEIPSNRQTLQNCVPVPSGSVWTT